MQLSDRQNMCIIKNISSRKVAIAIIIMAALATAQSAFPKDGGGKPVKNASNSETLLELKQEVLQLSYKSNGHRVIVLKDNTALGIENPDQSKRPVVNQNSRIPLQEENQTRQSGPSFEVSCNPIGEVKSVSPINSAAKASLKELNEGKFNRITELACLEPEFDPKY